MDDTLIAIVIGLAVAIFSVALIVCCCCLGVRRFSCWIACGYGMDATSYPLLELLFFFFHSLLHAYMRLFLHAYVGCECVMDLISLVVVPLFFFISMVALVSPAAGLHHHERRLCSQLRFLCAMIELIEQDE